MGTDSQRISRYENGRITPSVEALVRLADALEVSATTCLREGSPRRALLGPSSACSRSGSASWPSSTDEDRALVAGVVDGLLARRRLKILAGGVR